MGIKTLSRVLMDSIHITKNYYRDCNGYTIRQNIKIVELHANVIGIEEDYDIKARFAGKSQDEVLEAIVDGNIDCLMITKERVEVLFIPNTKSEEERAVVVSLAVDKKLSILVNIPRFNQSSEKYSIDTQHEEGNTAFYPKVSWEHDATQCNMYFQSDGYVIIEKGPTSLEYPFWSTV